MQAPIVPLQRDALPLRDVLHSLGELSDHIRVVDVAQPPDGWIAGHELLEPRGEPLAALLVRIGERYIDSRRYAAAASFMLRFSWSAGPMIAAHLGLGRGFRYHDYALRFVPSTAIEAVCIRRGEIVAASTATNVSRRRLLDALIDHTAPVLEAMHRWSRVSHRALWSMATSVWGAQFVEIAERLGDAELGRREAQVLFDLLPRIRRSAPLLYSVAEGGRAGVCQVRGACCLNHKGPNRQHCMVCPLIRDAERAERNRAWVASRPQARMLDPALLATLRERTR